MFLQNMGHELWYHTVHISAFLNMWLQWCIRQSKLYHLYHSGMCCIVWWENSKKAYSGSRERWVDNFNMPQPFYPQEKSPQYPWKRRLCRLQSQSRTFWRTENLFPLTGLEPGLSSLQPSSYSNYDMTSALITITICSNNPPFFLLYTCT
jgi:hypothetical protein